MKSSADGEESIEKEKKKDENPKDDKNNKTSSKENLSRKSAENSEEKEINEELEEKIDDMKKMGDMKNAIEDNLNNNKEEEISESGEQEIYSKKNKAQKNEFSFWSIDLYYHNKYSDTSPFIRYFIEILFVSMFLLLIPFGAMKIANENLPLKQIWNNEWGSLSHLASILKRNIFLLIFYLGDTVFFLFCENLFIFIINLLVIMDLDKSDNMLGLVQTLFSERNLMRITCSLMLLFYLLTIALGPFISPKNPWEINFDNFKAIILWLVIYSFIVFVVRFVVHFLTFDTKRSAYKKSIWELNYQTFIFKKLKLIGKAKSDGEDAIKHIVENFQPDYDPGYYLKDKSLFNSTDETKETTSNIFNDLEKEKLSYEDINSYFPDNSDDVFKYLSGSHSTKNKKKEIKLKQLINIALDLYERRKDMFRTLRDRDAVFDKLDLVFMLVVSYFSLVILLILFNVDYKVFITSFGTTFITFSWIFADSIKSVYKCFLFLLVIKPYDIGDNVKIDNEDLEVYKIDLLTSTFLTVFNKIVYIPNEQLCGKNIYNIARSATQFQKIEITVDPSTTYEMAINLNKKMNEKLKNNKKVALKCRFHEMAAGELNYVLEHPNNFQNQKKLRKNREKIIEIFISCMNSENIKFNNSIKFKD